MPRLESGLVSPQLTATPLEIEVTGGAERLTLTGDRPLTVEQDRVVARFPLRGGDSAVFALHHHRSIDPVSAPMDARATLDDTVAGWQSWTGMHQGYRGHYREQVTRSSLVLQALTYRPTAAVITAATTSLPEKIGGNANWDYRFGWLRDGSFTLKALWVDACHDLRRAVHQPPQADRRRREDQFSLLEQNARDGRPPVFELAEYADNPSVIALGVHEQVRAHGGDLDAYRRRMFTAWQEEAGRLSTEDIVGFGRNVGLRDFDRAAGFAAVATQHAQAAKLGVFGTPTLVLGPGQVVFVKLDSVPAADQAQPLWEAVGHLASSGRDLQEWQRITPPRNTR